MGCHVDAELVGDHRGGIGPGGAADSGEQAEPFVPGEIVRAIGYDGRRSVALPEFDTVGVELIVLQLQRLTQCLTLVSRLRGVVHAVGDARLHRLRIAGVVEPERLQDRAEFLDALVGPQHDLLADRRPFGVVDQADVYITRWLCPG